MNVNKWRLVAFIYVAIWVAVFMFWMAAVTEPNFFSRPAFDIFGAFFTVLLWVGVFGQFALHAAAYFISPVKYRNMMNFSH